MSENRYLTSCIVILQNQIYNPVMKSQQKYMNLNTKPPIFLLPMI